MVVSFWYWFICLVRTYNISQDRHELNIYSKIVKDNRMDEKQLINTKQAAEILGKSVRTIRRLIEQGNLPVAEWREGGRGGKSGKSPLLDRAILKNLIADINQDLSVRNQKTIADTIADTPVRNTPSISKRKINRDLDCKGWLSFGDVLELYIQEKQGESTPPQAQNGEILSNFSGENEIDKIYEGVFTPKSTEIDKINNGKKNKKSKKGGDKADKLEEIFSAAKRRITDHISKLKIISRPDPLDGRRTQILFDSLLPIHQELYTDNIMRKNLNSIVISKAPIYTNERSTEIKPSFFEKSKPQITTTIKQQAVRALYDTRYIQPARIKVLDAICAKFEITSSTVYRWYAKAVDPITGKLDLGKLLRKQNITRGIKKVKFSEECINKFKGCVLAHGTFNISKARRLVNLDFQENMSQRQAYEIINNDVELCMLWQEMRHKDRARWKNRLRIKQTRDGLRPLQLVTTDGHICDVKVKSPLGDFRPVIVEFFDVATGMALGWAIGRTESRELVSRALINAIIKFGHIAEIHQDQGKAFHQSDAIKQQIRDYLGTDLVTVPGYSPHLKAHQERNFGAAFEDYCGKLLIDMGYVGNSIQNRPTKTVGKDVEAVLTYAEFYKIVATFFEKIMPNRSQGGLYGANAAEVWKEWEDKKGFRVKRYFKDDAHLYKALILSLGTRKTVTVRSGYIIFTRNGEKFMFEAPFLSGGLDGKKVEIAFNIDNPTTVFVFFRGQLLGEADKREAVQVGQFAPWVKGARIAHNEVRKKALRFKKAEIDKVNLWEYQNEIEFSNAVGFDAEYVIADMAGTKLQEALDILTTESKNGRVIDMTQTNGLRTQPVSTEEKGIFDQAFEPDNIECEVVEFED